MPPFHHHGRGQRDGITPLFLPAGAGGSALALLHVACCSMRGPAGTPQTSKGSPSLSHHPASPPVPRSPFLASPTSPIATRVSTPPRLALRPPALHHLTSSPRADAAARWTPRAIPFPIPTVAMAAGSGWAIFVPTVIPAVAPGDSCIVPAVAATSRRP